MMISVESVKSPLRRAFFVCGVGARAESGSVIAERSIQAGKNSI